VTTLDLVTLPPQHDEELWVCHLGTIPYREALALQDDLAARRRAGTLPDLLLLLEHPPVYTRGRRSRPQELALGEGFYRARGIEVVPTDRGGRVTYHGPGQLVGYPIMAIADVLAHLRTIEDALVAALAQEGVRARSRTEDGPDYTGVWVGARKIASLGVHVSRGVSTHGFAINVANDLAPFTWIVPCGLPDVEMTSLACELGDAAPEDLGDASQWKPGDASLERFRARVAHCFCAAHRRHPRLVSPPELGLAVSEPPPSTPGRRPGASSPVEAPARVDDLQVPPTSPLGAPARQAVGV
jgi:lipoyl(octanoyl) transferase